MNNCSKNNSVARRCATSAELSLIVCRQVDSYGYVNLQRQQLWRRQLLSLLIVLNCELDPVKNDPDSKKRNRAA